MIDSLQQAFIEETRELLAELETTLLAVEDAPTDSELIAKLFRALHTIKGSSSMFGFDDIALFTHDIETAYDLIRNGELIETKADKMPIGVYDLKQPFSNNLVKLEKNDSFYLFSDGYADQFGGPKGKKFMYKKLKEMLLSIQDKTMQEQFGIIDKTIEEWRGDLFQVDDQLIIGVKI